MKPFSTADVMRMTGASARQLAWWIERSYLPPHLRDVGTGNPRRWTRADVETATRLKQASDLRRSTLDTIAS